MKYAWVLLLTIAALPVGGCGVDPELDKKVTINQGVYGLLWSAGVGAANQDVTIYAANASGAYASSTSDDQGVYQINLPIGDYTICTSGCTTISTPTNATVRYDWTDGPGGGTWNKL